MTAADEARAEVERQYPSWHDNGVGVVLDPQYRSGFIAGADWQASRNATEVAALAGRVQAAQATIAEALAIAVDMRRSHDRGVELWDILSRADTSALHAHDEALIRQHTQTILDATREATVQAIADAEVRGYQRKVDERITSARAASIEQTEAK